MSIATPKRFTILICISSFLLLKCISKNQKENFMSYPGKVEIKVINATISKLFEAISFEKGSPPNMHKIKDLFIEGGLLINYNEENPQTFRVEEFIDHFNDLYKQGLITGLEDREVHHKTKVYDRIAHRYSFYEARVSPDEKPLAVGINSIQLIKIGEHWKVSSMAWNDDVRGDGFFKRTMACIQSNQ